MLKYKKLSYKLSVLAWWHNIWSFLKSTIASTICIIIEKLLTQNFLQICDLNPLFFDRQYHVNTVKTCNMRKGYRLSVMSTATKTIPFQFTYIIIYSSKWMCTLDDLITGTLSCYFQSNIHMFKMLLPVLCLIKQVFQA